MRAAIGIGLAIITCALASPLPAQTAQGPAASADAPAAGLFIIRLRPGPSYRHDMPLLRQDLRDHGRYMRELTNRGIILLAGPTIAESGGLIVLRAGNLDEARAHMVADPAIRSGLFVGEVTDWTPSFDPGGRLTAPAPSPAR